MPWTTVKPIYLKFGFEPLIHKQAHLFLPMSTVRKLISEFIERARRFTTALAHSGYFSMSACSV